MSPASRASILALAWILALPAHAGAPAAGAPQGPAKGPSLGALLDPAVALALPSPGSTDRPLAARLVASWGEVESEKGVYDWSRIEPAVAKLSGAGFRVALCLTGSNPLYISDGGVPSPLVSDSLDAWTGFVRSAVRSFAGQVEVFEIWEGPARPAPGSEAPVFDPAVYAFVLKSSALAVRAEARAAGAEALVAGGGIRASDLAWQKEVWRGDASAYLDVLPVLLSAAESNEGPELGEVFRESVQHPPAPALWAYVEPGSDAAAEEAVAGAIRALSAPTPAAVALARVSGEPSRIERQARVLYGLHGALASFSAAPRGQLSFLDDHQVPVPNARAVGRFLSDATDDLATAIVYDAPGAGLAGRQAWLAVDAPDVRDARILDPLTGESVPTAPSKVPGRPGQRALRVVFAAHPMVLHFRRAPLPEGQELPTEELAVESTRGLTAEEIVARYQATQKIQDDRLDRWMSPARISFHFKFAQMGTAVDVGIDSNFLWERGSDLEWEQLTYYVNGNRVTWKSIPELPLIQPEKVVTLPLDLTLDRTYLYRLRGEDTVEGREAYVLEFDPVDPAAAKSLYRGRLWVDKETFVRLKSSLIQTNLEPPVVSNEEVDVYKPVAGPDGETYWMLSRIDGQQLWTIAGRNVVVNREVDFGSFEINPPKPAFDEARKAAYASKNLMLRDTDDGFRYLDRQEDGTRKVQDELRTKRMFAAAGAFKDSSIDRPVPLAGFNYFDFDLFHKDMQLDVLFAGVVAFVNVTQPALFGKRIDLAGEAVGIAIKGEDRVYEGETEIVTERIDNRGQYASVRLGFPAGSFFKLTTAGSLYYEQYFGNEEAESALAAENAANGTDLSFVLPSNHVLAEGTIQAEFNRRGYGLAVSGTWSRRSSWEAWGTRDDATGEFEDPEPLTSSYPKWGLTATKEWFLPKFQKVRAEVDYLDGRDLDRFSRYAFSLFGQERLNGFSGTGVRFDRGFIARTGYSFNLFGAIRFDLTLDRARVLDRASTAAYQDFTGVGLSGNVIGPWKTVIVASYGRAVQSDIPGLEGKQDFLLTILKLFR